jgi:hypothetical protein
MWLGMVPVAGFYEHDNEPPGSVKDGGEGIYY